MSDTSDTISIAEAARMLGRARNTIYKWIDDGILVAVPGPPRNVGGQIVHDKTLRRADVLALLPSPEQGGDGA